MPGRPAPIVLDDDDPGLLLLRRIRDEAHRFALTHHRKRRAREANTSLFDALPSIERAHRRAGAPPALPHAGADPRRLPRARGRPGVPAKTGRQIYAALHRAGRA